MSFYTMLIYEQLLKYVVLCSFKSNLFPLTVCHFAASLHLHWNWQELSWHLDGCTVECTESLTQAGCVLLIKHGSAGPSVPNDSDYMKSTCLWLLLNKWTLGIVLAPLNKNILMSSGIKCTLDILVSTYFPWRQCFSRFATKMNK